MKRTLHMETTKVSVDKTISEIQNCLKGHGMRRFNLMYDSAGDIEAVHFTLKIRIEGQPDVSPEIPYKLPANYEALLLLAQRGETTHLKRGDKDQARRIAWRQILRWVQAQFALIETGMVKAEEIFLPYMMVDETENTLYDKIKLGGFQQYLALEGRKAEGEKDNAR